MEDLRFNKFIFIILLEGISLPKELFCIVVLVLSCNLCFYVFVVKMTGCCVCESERVRESQGETQKEREADNISASYNTSENSIQPVLSHPLAPCAKSHPFGWHHFHVTAYFTKYVYKC